MKLFYALILFTLLAIAASAQHDAYHDCYHEKIEKCPENSTPSVLILYPNPTTEFFQIKGLVTENTEGVLFDSKGAKVRVFLLKNGEYNDINNLASGLYFLYITAYQQVFKLIKI